MPKKLHQNRSRNMLTSFSNSKKVVKRLPKESKSIQFKSYMSKNSKGFRAYQSCANDDDMEWINQIAECPVYHPSRAEFQDPLQYIQNIAPQASTYGVCKIVPPLISSVPTGVVIKNERPGFRFIPKVQPLRVAKWTKNDKNMFYISNKSYTLCDFEVMANRVCATKYCLSGCLPSAYIEREFWREMMSGNKSTVEYGVNVEGSAFSSCSNDHLANSNWNLKKLPRLPRSALRLVENAVPGVTDPMLYIGMLFSMFAWHVEDNYLYSINYHHCGAPKTWYGVPSSAANEFEKVIQHHVYTREVLSTDGPNGAFEMLAEKTTMFPPKILLQNQVPVYKVVQFPGEFVITFPRAYHSGFSHGFNCGEAVNFAAHDWFPFGGEANKRYILLRKKSIVPFEEILCKEAMLLFTKTPKKDNSCDTDAVSDHFVKTMFTSLIQKYDGAILRLKSLDRSLSITTNLKETISCSFCKRDCYVAHVNCNCRTDPVCVFHDKELSECCCGSNRLLSIRADLPKMKNVAKKFEEQKQPGVNRRHKHHDGLGRVEHMDSKTQQSNAGTQERKRSRKKRTCSRKNNSSVDVKTPVNSYTTRSKVGVSSKRRTRTSRRLKEVKKKCRKRASQCHLCCPRNAH